MLVAIDANDWHALGAQCMIEPYREGTCSSTTLSTFGTRMRIRPAMVAGSEANFPRQIRLPARRNGGPWFKDWQNIDYADLWRAEADRVDPAWKPA